jgi:hypothetical protein
MKLSKIITFAVILGLGAAFAASPGAKSASPADRLVVALSYIMDYQFFDHFYTQSLDGDAKYTEIQAYVKDSGGKPQTTIKLIEKGSGTATVYSDHIQYVPPAAYIPKAITGFAFRDRDGQPVRWRFTLAYPPSAQGSGLTVLPNDPTFKLIYRDSGSLSDADSAVELSGKVNTVQVWREISQPPYFVAYRGTYTEGAETTQLRTDLEKLEFTGASGLKSGAQFQLVTASGKSRQLSVETQPDGLLIKQLPDESGISRELLVTSDAQGYGVRSLKVIDGSHSATVKFTPALRLPAAGFDGPSSEFQIVADKSHKLGNGAAHLSPKVGGAQLVWKVSSPGWAKNRTIVQTLAVSDQGVAIAMAR